MRTVFMGSPEFGIPTLECLMAISDVAGVVTQPDRPAGRGRALTPPPVKILAQRLGLPVLQPDRLSAPEAMAALAGLRPDVIVVAAYGQILKPDALNLAPYGCINVHASLLPRHRGAAPVPAAILAGDAETGVTLMKMDPGLDTGPILAQKKTPILPEDDAQSLLARLANLGAEILGERLAVYLQGELKTIPQEDSLATYAPRLKKQDGFLSADLPARDLERKVRACHPWPGAFILVDGVVVKVLSARSVESPSAVPAGTIRVIDRFPAVQTAEGWLILKQIQPAGRRAMAGDVFLLGAPDFAGKIISSTGG
jgi:methionyl-tRNA formyltransferase